MTVPPYPPPPPPYGEQPAPQFGPPPEQAQFGAPPPYGQPPYPPLQPPSGGGNGTVIAAVVVAVLVVLIGGIGAVLFLKKSDDSGSSNAAQSSTVETSAADSSGSPSTTEEDSTSPTSTAASVPNRRTLEAMKPGDCFNEDPSTHRIRTASCSGAHTAQIYAILRSKAANAAAAGDDADRQCSEDANQSRIESDRLPDGAMMVYYFPEPTAWAVGARQIECAIEAKAGTKLRESYVR